MKVSDQEVERVLFETYPELEEMDDAVCQAYLKIITDEITSYNYGGYYTAIREGFKLLQYKPKDEPKLMLIALSKPLLLREVPPSYQTAKMWDVFLKIIYEPDSSMFPYIIERMAPKLRSNYFNWDRSLLLLLNLKQYEGASYWADLIDKFIPVETIRNKEFLSTAIAQGIPFRMIHSFFKRYRVKIDMELATPYLKYFNDILNAVID